MKNILLILLLIFPVVSYGQVIDYNSFDNDLIDSLVVVEINRYRNEVGSSALTYSKVIHDSISVPNTNRMITDRKIADVNTKKQLNQSLFNSILQKDKEILNKYGDVSAVISSNGFSESTYELLSFNIVETLIKNRSKEFIISEWGNNIYDVNTDTVAFSAASVQLGMYSHEGVFSLCFYVSFQILYDYPNGIPDIPSRNDFLLRDSVFGTKVNFRFNGLPTGQENVVSSSLEKEIEFVRILNEKRIEKGLSALVINEDLCKAARYHSYDMATEGYFTHDSQDRGSISVGTFDRINQFAGPNPGNTQSENIAAGNRSPQKTYIQWFNSRTGHKENMFGNWKEIGIGYVNIPGSKYTHYWTTDFR
jgi:uncharacterized protein YkwD